MFVGSLGFITKESISNKSEKSEKIIPVAIFYEIPSYQSIDLPLTYNSELSFFVESVGNVEKPLNYEEYPEIGGKLYFEALEMVIFKNLFSRYKSNWYATVEHYMTPNGMQTLWEYGTDKGQNISYLDFFKLNPSNRFMRFKRYKMRPFNEKMVLPPNTIIKYESINNSSKYTLKNKFVTVELMVSRKSSSAGVGEFSELIDDKLLTKAKMDAGEKEKGLSKTISSFTKGFHNSVYLISINIEQNIWYNGHPDMKKYRHWADSIVDTLESKFSYELIREKLIDNSKKILKQN